MSVTDTITEVWNEYDDETRRQELSHWRGVGKWADDKKWQGVGRRTLGRMQTLHRHLRRPVRFADSQPTMLEWGPGGGSNAFAFREIATAYYGIDISEKNLAEASRVMAEDGHGDVFRPVHLQEDPDFVKTKVTEPVDAFLSTAVFQHFPSKEYGYEVMKAIRSVCRDGAIGVVQIRFDNGAEDFRANVSIDQYKKRFIKATSYQIDEFWGICVGTGFEMQYIDALNPKSHYVSFNMMAA